MHFSWTGLILAPLPAPLIACAVMAPLLKGEGPVVLPFLILLLPACMLAYGTTIFLFLPAMFLLSLRRPVAGWIACLLGFVLGAAAVVPVTLLAWKGGGPDSGPPTESLLTFFPRFAFDPFMLIFPAAGLLTAALYWWFGAWRQSHAATLAATKN